MRGVNESCQDVEVDRASDGPFVDNHRYVKGGELPAEVYTGAAKHKRESGVVESGVVIRFRT